MAYTLIEYIPDQLTLIRQKKLTFDHVAIKPGINYQLTESEVQKLLSHPDFMPLIGKGIRVIAPTEAPPEVVNPEANNEVPNLSAYPVDETDDLIRKTEDLGILERWLKAETRKTVRQQINSRITAIKEGRG